MLSLRVPDISRAYIIAPYIPQKDNSVHLGDKIKESQITMTMQLSGMFETCGKI